MLLTRFNCETKSYLRTRLYFTVLLHIFLTLSTVAIYPLDSEIISYSLIFFVYLLVIFRSYQRTLHFIYKPSIIILLGVIFYFYFALSSLWSMPDLSIYLKALGILALIFVSGGFAAYLDATLIIRHTVFYLFVFTTIGIVICIFLPDVGLETGWRLDGDWRGLAGQKNSYGAYAGILIIFSIIGIKFRMISKFTAITSIIIGVFALLMSDSRGALVMTISSLIFIGIFWLPVSLQIRRIIYFSFVFFVCNRFVFAYQWFSYRKKFDFFV